MQLKPENLNKGLISTTEQLLAGQVAGLRVIPNAGAPGAGAQMILRSGTSIFGSIAPLVVLDGVPLEPTSASDHNSSFSFLNPNDIATITLLKDAASMAIYGGRAANGVLLITTKQANKTSNLKLDYTTTAGISVLRKKADVLSSGEFREMVQRDFPEQEHLLGKYDTDWQDVIFRNAFSHDQNLSLSGALFKAVPFRVSYGYLNQNGILKTSQAKRNSLALSLNPSFLQDHLRLNVYLRKADEYTRIADKYAITQAWAFDPTQPVYQDNRYGGYFTYLRPNGEPNDNATTNPLSLLEQGLHEDETSNLLGQVHLQYKLHFLPSLSVNIRYAFQDQQNDFTLQRPAEMASVAWLKGWLQTRDRSINWKKKEAFLSLDQPLGMLQSKLQVVLGASVKDHEQEQYNLSSSGRGSFSEFYYMISNNYTSVFGQAAFSVKGKYLLEAALTREQSSLLPATDRTFVMGSGGVSWNLLKESFLAGKSNLSQLKLYANYSSYGKPDNSSLVMTSMFNSELKVERTNKWNAGLTWGIRGNRLSGDLNYYRTSTKDMLIIITLPPINGFPNSNTLKANNGGFLTSGLETNLRYQLISRPDLNWSIGTNLNYLKSEVSDFRKGSQLYHYGDELVLSPGKPINSFYLYEQLYDSHGKPIEKGYKKDVRGYDEKQVMRTVDPSLVFGLNSEINYRKLSADFLLRGSLGNNVFNYAEAYRNALYMASNGGYMENISGKYTESGFNIPQLHSNYFLEKASFARLEYLQLGYNVGNIWRDRAALKLNATVQNAFVITKYKGQDPEVTGGIDRGQYPQPRTFSVGLNLSI